jgi:hypothetical protein
METSRRATMMFRLKGNKDQQVLAGWVQPDLRQVSGLQS